VLNFEKRRFVPSQVLKDQLEGRPGSRFYADEADHMQINAHWPVIDYYGYNDKHYLAETDGSLFTALAGGLILERYNQPARCRETGCA
jgi:hypothetical protein